MKTFGEAILYSQQNPTEIIEWKWYYKDGTLNDHCFFLNGDQHGECKWFNENGTIREHCFFLNDNRHGEYKWFNENGTIREHCFFLNGKYQPQLDYLTTDRDEITLTLMFGDNYENIQLIQRSNGILNTKPN